MYSDLTYNSKSKIKRFSHSARYEKYVALLAHFSNGKDGFRFLDFGTGDGHVFNLIADENLSQIKQFAYEPIAGQRVQLENNVAENKLDVTVFGDLKAIDGSFDMILCAEVLEHFSALNVLNMLEDISIRLSYDGIFVVSVPIETGLAGLMKNITRGLLGQVHGGLTPKNIVKSFFGIPFFRGNDFYLSSHVGFSHKRLEYLLIDGGFEIVKKDFTPLPWLRSLCNSQAFFVCKKNQ